MIEKVEELYAVLEIKNCRVSFMVGVYEDSVIKVLYKKTLESSVAINGVIQDPIKLGNDLKSLIKEANNELNLNIKRISIAIPNDNLVIKNVSKTLNFANFRPVDEVDIDELITGVKKTAEVDKEVEFFVRPYRYLIGKESFTQPPIGNQGSQITIKALVYSTTKDILSAISLMCSQAKVEIMGILPQPFALAWNIAHKNDLQRGIIIVDWDHDAVKAYVFLKEALCQQFVIPGGINKIITELKKIMQCDIRQVKKYLFKMINLANHEKNNLVIYSKYNQILNKQISLTHFDIREIINNIILEDLATLNSQFFNTLEYNFPIVITGEILKISGFSNNLLYYNKDREIMVNLPKIIGARNPWCAGLLGNIFYQHLVNKMTGSNIYSINEILDYDREHLRQINLANQQQKNHHQRKLMFFTRMSKLKPINKNMGALNNNPKSSS